MGQLVKEENGITNINDEGSTIMEFFNVIRTMFEKRDLK